MLPDEPDTEEPERRKEAEEDDTVLDENARGDVGAEAVGRYSDKSSTSSYAGSSPFMSSEDGCGTGTRIAAPQWDRGRADDSETSVKSKEG